MKTKILVLAIVLLGGILRFYKLDSAPPSLNWDEAAVGYNAYTLANFGKDEYGIFFPLYFLSFGEGKNPIHIYFTALSIKLLGLNEFSTRLPSALFGIFNIILIYLLVKIIFEKEVLALLTALFLAISPFNIHFSRFNHEANFTLFFFMLGAYVFFANIKKEKKLLWLSMVSFCLSFLSYNAAKIFIPLALVLVTILYLDKLRKIPKQLVSSLLILIFFGLLIITHPQLLGGTRAHQTMQGRSDIEKTYFFKIIDNELLGRINLAILQYSWHFQPEFLFITGDKNPKLSSQTGEFYRVEIFLLILGVFYLMFKKSKEGAFILIWALLGPLPSSLAAEAPHAARSAFMMGSWHIISALGLYFLIGFVKNPLFKKITVIIFLLIFAYSLKGYLTYYYGEYLSRYAIEWQYGMKQIVEYIGKNDQYSQIFMTDIRAQPYIYFLYFLKTPLSEYLQTVIYNNSQNKSSNNISAFSNSSFASNGEQKKTNFYFGGWNTVESSPQEDTLYVLSPSEYDGLRHKSSFEIKKVIYYPNGQTAFLLVSAL